MKQELRELVWLRAQSQCEYCQMPQQFVDLSHEVDHIIGEQHRGTTVSENLALACYSWMQSEQRTEHQQQRPRDGQDGRSFQPENRRVVGSFSLAGAVLIGTTAVGRATVELLKINAVDRIHLRRSLIEEGVFPPNDNRETSSQPG